MSIVKKIETTERKSLGTGATRAIRRSGYVPVSVYGKNQTPVNLSIEERFLVKEMKDRGFYSHLFEVKVGSKDQMVVVRDVQLHPVSDRPLHLDLLAVDENSVIKVDVTIKTKNEEKSPGLKLGGVMTLLRHELPLLCKPNNIPEFVYVDLAGLKMGGAIHLADVTLPDDVKVDHPEKIETLVTISQPRVSGTKSSSEDGASEDAEEDNTSTNDA